MCVCVSDANSIYDALYIFAKNATRQPKNAHVCHTREKDFWKRQKKHWAVQPTQRDAAQRRDLLLRLRVHGGAAHRGEEEDDREGGAHQDAQQVVALPAPVCVDAKRSRRRLGNI